MSNYQQDSPSWPGQGQNPSGESIPPGGQGQAPPPGPGQQFSQPGPNWAAAPGQGNAPAGPQWDMPQSQAWTGAQGGSYSLTPNASVATHRALAIVALICSILFCWLGLATSIPALVYSSRIPQSLS